MFSLAPLDLLLPKVPVGGIVRDAISSEPIAGRKVRLGPIATTTDGSGAFSVDRVSLTDTIQVEADGYQTGQVAVWPPHEQRIVLQPHGLRPQRP